MHSARHGQDYSTQELARGGLDIFDQMNKGCRSALEGV